MRYHQMIMALHRPSPLMPQIPSSFIPTLLNSAMTSVELYDHYSTQKRVLVNWVHLHQLFTSCTSLVYCFREHSSRPDLVDYPSDVVQRWTARCRALLAKFSPKWPQSERYQAMFDELAAPFSVEGCPPAPTGDIAIQEPLDVSIADQHGPIEFPIWTESANDTSPSQVMRGFWGDVSSLSDQM